MQRNQNILKIEGIDNTYSGITLYPSIFLQPSNNLFLFKSNYKYVIFKYRLHKSIAKVQNEEIVREEKSLNEYYYQSMSISEFGNGNIQIKYERS